MESVSRIRRWVLVEGRSIRSVARATGLSRIEAIDRHWPEDMPKLSKGLPVGRQRKCQRLFDLRGRVVHRNEVADALDGLFRGQVSERVPDHTGPRTDSGAQSRQERDRNLA